MVKKLIIFILIIFTFACESGDKVSREEQVKFLTRSNDGTIKRLLNDVFKAQEKYIKIEESYFQCDNTDCLRYAPRLIGLTDYRVFLNVSVNQDSNNKSAFVARAFYENSPNSYEISSDNPKLRLFETRKVDVQLPSDLKAPRFCRV